MLEQRLILKLNDYVRWILEQDAAARNLRAALSAFPNERDGQLLQLQSEPQELKHMGAQIVSALGAKGDASLKTPKPDTTAPGNSDTASSDLAPRSVTNIHKQPEDVVTDQKGLPPPSE